MISDGAGLWAETAPPGPDCPALHGTSTVDVAVVGAGYTGLSAALHLAQAGVSVAVLEVDRIGAGGSGRNVGLVNAGMWTPPDVLTQRLGPVHGPRLLAALSKAPSLVWDLVDRHAMTCEATPRGTLHCAPDARGAAALGLRARQWQASGAPVTLLDRATTQERTGSPHYIAALFDPRAGTIQPMAYARELARAARDAGAQVFTQSPVRSLDPDGGRWSLVTPQGRVQAEQVIVASNAYSVGPFSPLRREIAVLPYFNFATEPLDNAQRASILPGGEGLWDTRKILTSARMEAGGRLVIGSVGALGQPLEARLHTAWAARRMALLFPQLSGVRFSHGWGGWIGTTPDALPRFHRVANGVWSVSGYNGRGIAPGTVFGRMLADLARGTLRPEDMPLPCTPPRPDRLAALREAIYRAGSAVMHGLDGR